MLARLRKVLEQHHAAIVEAEALVFHQRFAGVAMARAAAEDPHQDEEHRRYWRLVARIAEQRLAIYRIPDVATVYDIENGWMCRRGQNLLTAQ